MRMTLFIFMLVFSHLTLAEEAVSSNIPAAVNASIEEANQPVPSAKLAEDQIPLSIDTDRKSPSGGSSTTKAAMSAFIVIALIGTSYYFVRRYKVSNTVNKSNMKIKVLTQHYLGPKKSLAIVHVAGESILIGVTDQNISMIKSLSLIDDEVPAEMPQTFSDSMAKSMKAQPPAPVAASVSLSDELDEEFSFAGVTDTVSKKIKSMRSFS